MPVCDDDADCAEALKRFFHEMGAEPATQPKLSVTASTSLPSRDRRPVLLEARGKQAERGLTGVRPSVERSRAVGSATRGRGRPGRA